MGVEYTHYIIPEDNTYRPGPEVLTGLIDALLDGGFVFRSGKDTNPQVRCGLEHVPGGEDWGHCGVRFGDNTYSSFNCPCSADELAALGEQDFILAWSVDSSDESGLTYPLCPYPEFGDASYEIEVHVATDFVYHLSELIHPFDEVACPCGRDLRYSEWEESSEPQLIESDPTRGSYIYTLDDEPRTLPLYADSRIFRLCPTCGRPFRPQDLVARVKDARTGVVRERAGGATYRFAVVVDCGKCFSRAAWPIRASAEFMDMVSKAFGQKFYEIGDIC